MYHHLANDEVDLVLYKDFDLRAENVLNFTLGPFTRVVWRLGQRSGDQGIPLGSNLVRKLARSFVDVLTLRQKSVLRVSRTRLPGLKIVCQKRNITPQHSQMFTSRI